MRNIGPRQSSSFPKLDRVIRNQRWLAIANGLVTFALLIGTFGAAASFVG